MAIDNIKFWKIKVFYFFFKGGENRADFLTNPLFLMDDAMIMDLIYE